MFFYTMKFFVIMKRSNKKEKRKRKEKKEAYLSFYLFFSPSFVRVMFARAILVQQNTVVREGR